MKKDSFTFKVFQNYRNSFKEAVRVLHGNKAKSKIDVALFDVIDFEDDSTYELPLTERKELLYSIAERVVPARIVKDEQELKDLYNMFLSKGFEGIVVKTGASPYVFGRTDQVQKLKPVHFKDFTIVDKSTL